MTFGSRQIIIISDSDRQWQMEFKKNKDKGKQLFVELCFWKCRGRGFFSMWWEDRAQPVVLSWGKLQITEKRKCGRAGPGSDELNGTRLGWSRLGDGGLCGPADQEVIWMDFQAYGPGNAGRAFDPLTFFRQPQTLVRVLCWVGLNGRLI